MVSTGQESGSPGEIDIMNGIILPVAGDSSARASRIPARRIHSFPHGAGIEWRCCHHAVYMARHYEEHHHSGRRVLDLAFACWNACLQAPVVARVGRTASFESEAVSDDARRRHSIQPRDRTVHSTAYTAPEIRACCTQYRCTAVAPIAQSCNWMAVTRALGVRVVVVLAPQE